MIFDFDILAIPKQSVRQGMSRSGKVIFYQDNKYAKYSKELTKQLKSQLPVGFLPFSGPLDIAVTYIFPPLKSFRKADREHIESGGHILKTTKPDVIDNLNKAFFDAMEGILYNNDSEISVFAARKMYGKRPRIIIRVEQLTTKYI